MAGTAAFFDLDRTILRRSSTLALAGSFREYGVIRRRDLVRAALLQLLFVARGTTAEAVARAADEGLMLLRGFTPQELQELVAGAMETVLRPLVYREPLDLVHRHRERGEPVFIVSAALQEVVDAIARDLGFDGALGTVCEVVDGAYTGQSVRALHGEAKAEAVRELAAARGYDLGGSTAYSDSHADLPFLEAVGHPVAVNPDRVLRRVAAERGWPVLEFGERLVPRPRGGVPAAAALWLPFLAGIWLAKRRAA